MNVSRYKQNFEFDAAIELFYKNIIIENNKSEKIKFKIMMMIIFYIDRSYHFYAKGNVIFRIFVEPVEFVFLMNEK